MPASSRRSWKLWSLPALVALVGGAYLARDRIFFTFIYRGTRAEWELSQIQWEFRRQSLLRTGVAADTAELSRRCAELAESSQGTNAELGALLLLAGYWPETAAGQNAAGRIEALAQTADLKLWSDALQRVDLPAQEGLRPIVVPLIRQVRERSSQTGAALVVTKLCRLVAPDTDVAQAPAEFAELADLIREHYAESPEIANFCEHLGNSSPTWALPFEPHLRRILAVNQDRFVRCSAKIALAGLVQSTEAMRQPEAKALYEEFLAEFSGDVDYHAAGIERMYREQAQRELETIRSHGLGKLAPQTVGMGIDGQPMSLADYRGKVVLVSFWGTWCSPCMKLLPYERQLVERMDADDFAIVGVNSDSDAETALQACRELRVTWRSFHSQEEGESDIADQWKVVAYPTLYLLDRQGFVARRWIGAPPPDTLESAVAALMTSDANHLPASSATGAR